MRLLEDYPMKRSTIFMERIAHSAMIDKPVAYMKTGVTISETQFPKDHWERVKAEYWARRMIWC